MRACQLHDHLKEFLANIDLQVLHGKKVVEVKPLAINKGKAALEFMKIKKWDFILALGDDWTDEDMFKALPPLAYSIKVGFGTTRAQLYIESPQECRVLLKKMLKT
jgi:trehalose 6-phosphate synthase/phosphatase